MTTGQFPRRRETDAQQALRAARLAIRWAEHAEQANPMSNVQARLLRPWFSASGRPRIGPR